MSNCPECNKTMGLHDLFVAGLCPSCAGKHITHQAERIKDLEAEKKQWKARYTEVVNDMVALKKELNQALKG